MFNKNDFGNALKFARNLKYDDPLLAEISRLHGDYFYNKKEYNNAIEKYKNTIEYLEPSYVIKRFLEAQQIEDLINYLKCLQQY